MLTESGTILKSGSRYFNLGVKPQLEQTLGLSLNNMIVATVAKSWASIYNPALPYGWRSESPHISADGGVCWFNAPTGEYDITALKAGRAYETITFRII